MLSNSDYVNHFLTYHDETSESLTSLLKEIADQHPGWEPLALMELAHNRQHTSLDWDAQHPEEDLTQFARCKNCNQPIRFLPDNAMHKWTHLGKTEHYACLLTSGRTQAVPQKEI